MKNFSYRTLVAVLIFGLLSFNIPLTPAKASVDDGLAAHWELDEETGTDLEDSAGGSTGIISGNAKHTLGKIGRALLFDENDQSANINSGTGELSAFSISLWLKTEDDSADAIITDNVSGFTVLLCENGKMGVKPHKNNDAILCGTQTVNDGEWHHVVATFDGSFAHLIVDGSSAESGQWGWSMGGLYFEPLTLRLNMTRTGANGNYEGYVDDVRLYNRALTIGGEEDETVVLYELGNEENETEPYLEFTSQPEDVIDVNHAEYTFVAQYETELACSLDDIELDDCVSPTNLTSLEAGDHIFKVTAFDELFNETTIEHTFNVDLGTPFILATSTVSVVTNVINNNAGTAQPAAFTITVDALNASNPSFPGSTVPVEVVFEGNGYTVSGSVSPTYTLSLSEGCQGSLVVGVEASCTLTYDDIVIGTPPTNGDDDTTGNPPSTGGTNTGNVGNGDDDLPGTPPSTGGTNTGGTTNGDDDNSVPPENNTGNVGNGDDDLPGDTHGNDNGNTTNGDDDVAGTPQQSEETPTVVQQSFRTSSGGSSPSPKKLISNSLPSLADIGSCSYINDYLSIQSNNNPTEVAKLQTFLVNTEEMNISVNGIFDQNTFDAVKAFQTKYLDEVMLPWGLQTATGVVSYTTKKKINEIYCKTTFSLTPEQIAAIERYRTSLGSSEEFVAPDNIEVGFAEPENVETPIIAEQTIEEVPVTPEIQQTQTASALDASGGFFQKIVDFFKNLF